MAHNWQAATVRQRDVAWEELEQWAWGYLGKPAVECTPNDLVVYLESSYKKHHGKQKAADGSRCPAPSSIAGMVSHLSTRYKELGQRGTWDWAAGTGNPCNSMELRTYKGGYANEMEEAGYSSKSAKPITEAKLQRLVELLVQEARLKQQYVQPWYVEALLWRDACIAQYLWDSMRRPAEARGLTTDQVQIGSIASSSSSKGEVYVETHARQSKMCHASHGTRRPRPVHIGEEAGGQLVGLMLQYIACLQTAGKSMGRFMFSPLRPDREGLHEDQGLSTSGMGQRIIGHLKRYGLFEGESLYSIKRGECNTTIT